MSESLFTLTIGSHFYKCNSMAPRAKQVIVSFAQKFVLYGVTKEPGGRFLRTPVSIFAAATHDRLEYRFHINTLKEFKDHLERNYLKDNLYTTVVKSISEGKELKFKLKPGWVPREDQLPILEYLQQPTPIIKFIGAQTGFGKTAVSVMDLVKTNKRVVVLIRSMYIQKWVNDFLNISTAKKEDILVVRGSASLLGLLELARKSKLKASVILVSNTTMGGWIKEYEKLREETFELGYPCIPEDFYSYIGAGVKLVDETHLDLRLNNKLDLYCNVAKSISLSATLLSRDPFITKMQEMMFPLMERCPVKALDKYINSFAVFYRFLRPEKIKTKEYGSGNYNHGALEKSVMKDPFTQKNYFRLVNFVLQTGYNQVERTKKRCLIFCYTQDMCEKLCKFLKLEYPALDIRIYIGGSDIKDILEPDICISTLGSAGAAIDIPDLTTVILTNNVDSITSNVQGLGRLRRLSDGHPVEFYYLCCTDIPKHREYSDRRIKVLQERAASFKPIFSNFCV